MPGIYMNIIFYLKNLKKTSTGNKNFKKGWNVDNNELKFKMLLFRRIIQNIDFKC